jgi:hypothetical protein
MPSLFLVLDLVASSGLYAKVEVIRHDKAAVLVSTGLARHMEIVQRMS